MSTVTQNLRPNQSFRRGRGQNFHRNRDYRPRYYDNRNSDDYQSRPYRRGGHFSVPGAFFLGNVDKQLTREDVYDFIKNETPCYITKFDMPNVPGNEFDKEGRQIKCAGFAFVHVKHQWMADEMLNMGKIRIGNLEAEIKPYDQMKREMSERRYRQSSASAGSWVKNEENYEDEKTWEEDRKGVRSWIQENEVTSSSTPRTSTAVDWSADDPNYNPNDYMTKINQFAGDYCVEDDSVYQTEDETASVLSAVNVNILEPSSNFSSRPASRASGRVGRNKPKTGIKVPTEIVGEITTKLLNDGITPTADKINEIANEKYNVKNKIVSQESSTGKRSSQETVINQINQSTTQINQSNPANQLSALQNPVQNLIFQTPISIGVPSLPQQNFFLPPTHIPYVQSPLHQTMEMLANQLTSMDEYHSVLYATLVQQWTQYYLINPQEISNHFSRSQSEQEQIMAKNALEMTSRSPVSIEQHQATI